MLNVSDIKKKKKRVYYTVSETHILIFINYSGLSILTSSTC